MAEGLTTQEGRLEHCCLCRVSVSGLLAEQPRNVKQHTGSEDGALGHGAALPASVWHVPSVFLPVCLYQSSSQNRLGMNLLKNTFSLNTFCCCCSSVQKAPADLERQHCQCWGLGDRQGTLGLLVFFHLVTYFMGRNQKPPSIEWSVEQQMPNSGFKRTLSAVALAFKFFMLESSCEFNWFLT